VIILAAATVLGVGLWTAFVCWVLRMFDVASELRADELHALLEPQGSPSTWHDGEWDEP
jgi:hypothetical protein